MRPSLKSRSCERSWRSESFRPTSACVTPALTSESDWAWVTSGSTSARRSPDLTTAPSRTFRATTRPETADLTSTFVSGSTTPTSRTLTWRSSACTFPIRNGGWSGSLALSLLRAATTAPPPASRMTPADVRLQLSFLDMRDLSPEYTDASGESSPLSRWGPVRWTLAPGPYNPRMDETRIRQRMAAARRIVVKAGTNVIMRDDGAVALGRLYGLIESVASLKKQGRHVLIVSSGAVGLGAQRLRLEKKPGSLTLKQACAAIGQSRLMSVYEDGFEKMGLLTAQVLLTEDDFTDRSRFQNLSATLEKLFELDAVPILNENDTVSTLELESKDGKGARGLFGDNDRLSALVMSKVRADVLVILSDVDGLFTGNPAHDRAATLIPLVREITEEIARYADGGSGRGRGGMASKLDAARIATASVGVAVIANGRTPGVLDRLFAGEQIGTLFVPKAGTRER